jgi:hypothetical protein
MFEDLFEGPIARARQRESPLPEERRFLSHLQALGYQHSSLRAIACELIVIATRLDLSGSDPLDAAAVEAAARRRATHQIRRQPSTDAALSRRNFRYWAQQWLRFLGRWKDTRVVASPFRALLDGFTTWMADEQGLAPASIRSHGWKTATFLTWYGRQERPIADVAIQDVDDFLAAKGKATWSRRSVARDLSHRAGPAPADLVRRAVERRQSRVAGRRCPDSASWTARAAPRLCHAIAQRRLVVQDGSRVAAEWRAPLFPPLSVAPHVSTTAHHDVLASEPDQFRHVQTGLDGDGQQGPIAAADPRRQVGRGEDGRDLRRVEERNGFALVAFAGHREDLLAQQRSQARVGGDGSRRRLIGADCRDDHGADGAHGARNGEGAAGLEDGRITLRRRTCCSWVIASGY